MNKRTIFTAVAATGFAMAGCDSQAENEVEEQAVAIDEAYEADADLEEAMTEGGPEEEAGEAAADELRATGEETKDQLEDAADEMDPEPQ